MLWDKRILENGKWKMEKWKMDFRWLTPWSKWVAVVPTFGPHRGDKAWPYHNPSMLTIGILRWGMRKCLFGLAVPGVRRPDRLFTSYVGPMCACDVWFLGLGQLAYRWLLPNHHVAIKGLSVKLGGRPANFFSPANQ